jgi:hypothetical protein
MEVLMKIYPVVSGAIAPSATNRVPPAQAAREALSAQSELAGLPFGKLVSAIARGLPLPSAPTSTPEPASMPEEPPTPEVTAAVPQPDPSEAL